MRLDSLTRPELVFPDLAGTDRRAVLREMAARIADALPKVQEERLERSLNEREELGSTAIGAGVAVPHCKMKEVDRVVLAVGICPQGVDFGAVDGQPVRVLFTLISPRKSAADHLQSLAAISRWIRIDGRVSALVGTRDRAAILELLGREEAA